MPHRSRRTVWRALWRLVGVSHFLPLAVKVIHLCSRLRLDLFWEQSQYFISHFIKRALTSSVIVLKQNKQSNQCQVPPRLKCLPVRPPEWWTVYEENSPQEEQRVIFRSSQQLWKAKRTMISLRLVASNPEYVCVCVWEFLFWAPVQVSPLLKPTVAHDVPAFWSERLLWAQSNNHNSCWKTTQVKKGKLILFPHNMTSDLELGGSAAPMKHRWHLDLPEEPSRSHRHNGATKLLVDQTPDWLPHEPRQNTDAALKVFRAERCCCEWLIPVSSV